MLEVSKGDTPSPQQKRMGPMDRSAVVTQGKEKPPESEDPGAMFVFRSAIAGAIGIRKEGILRIRS